MLYKVAFSLNKLIFKTLACIIYFGNFKSKTSNFAIKHFILFQIDFWIKFFVINNNLNFSVNNKIFNYLLSLLGTTLVQTDFTFN